MKIIRPILTIIIALLLPLTACSPTKAETPMAEGAKKTSAAPSNAKRTHVGVKELLQREVPAVGTKTQLTDEDFKKLLTDEEYYVLRKDGTERAFTGEYNKLYKKGVYHCRACNAPLFTADTKFDSGTGWPSYYAPIKGRVGVEPDHKFGMVRTEITCEHCGSHLGHVFDDGPDPTNLRYCVNSASLAFNEGADQSVYELDLDQETAK